jgi:autotransporter translocation and assembly factor TamB
VQLQRLQRGRKQPDAESTPAESGRATNVHVKLGRQVILSQGTMLYAPVSGELDVLVREEMRLRGKVQLGNGGLINLKGRKFRVQNGTITWTENDEPSNPVVIASAQWEAPDKTNVIASFTGPAKTGKLDLRSEPARTKGEILSLLLFGTTDGRTGGGGGSVAATGATLGGGVAAGGLGRALSKLTDVEIEASVKSPDSRTTRPEVAVRVRPDVTLQVGYNIAPPAVQRDRWLLTVDWRIAQRWSVQATEGDRGTTILDLLWQYRY